MLTCFLVFAESGTTDHEEAGSLQHCQTTLLLLLQRREGTARYLFPSSACFCFFAFGLAEKSKVVKQTFMSPFSHTLNTIVSLKKGSDPFLGMTNIEAFLVLSCRSSLLETRF